MNFFASYEWCLQGSPSLALHRPAALAVAAQGGKLRENKIKNQSPATRSERISTHRLDPVKHQVLLLELHQGAAGAGAKAHAGVLIKDFVQLKKKSTISQKKTNIGSIYCIKTTIVFLPNRGYLQTAELKVKSKYKVQSCKTFL